jgi:hypothetical protein
MMAEFLDDPAIRCSKHGKEFEAETCGQCASLVVLANRIKLLNDLGEAMEAKDYQKVHEISEKMQKQIIVDQLFEGK